MSEMNGWKIYSMNDCDWYAARSPEEAIEAMRVNTGYASLEDLKADAMFESEPEELSDEELDSRIVHLEDSQSGLKASFREQLQTMIANSETLPGFFASTEF